jgi:hypothetical protein
LAIDASACLVRPVEPTFPRTSGMCSVALEKRWLAISGIEIVPAITFSRMSAVWLSR